MRSIGGLSSTACARSRWTSATENYACSHPEAHIHRLLLGGAAQYLSVAPEPAARELQPDAARGVSNVVERHGRLR